MEKSKTEKFEVFISENANNTNERLKEGFTNGVDELDVSVKEDFIDDYFEDEIEDSLPSEGTLDASFDNQSVKIISEELELLKYLVNVFEEKIKVDSHKNELFNNLFQELETYKKDLYSKLLKPFLLDAIILVNDLNKLLRDIDSSDADGLFKLLKEIPQDIIDILERNGIEVYSEDNEGHLVDLKTQTVLKKIITDELSLDNVVVDVVCQGYKWDGVILRKEVVNIYKYKQ